MNGWMGGWMDVWMEVWIQTGSRRRVDGPALVEGDGWMCGWKYGSKLFQGEKWIGPNW